MGSKGGGVPPRLLLYGPPVAYLASVAASVRLWEKWPGAPSTDMHRREHAGTNAHRAHDADALHPSGKFVIRSGLIVTNDADLEIKLAI